VATLNAPKSLNALSLEMIRQLDAKLEAWAVDRSIVAVWLEGSGDKAFCAGGDVVALYRSLTEEGENRGAGRDGLFAETYFATEYRLDYRIHTYPKPLMVWGDGIVMGGGLGLMAGGFQRLPPRPRASPCRKLPSVSIRISAPAGFWAACPAEWAPTWA